MAEIIRPVVAESANTTGVSNDVAMRMNANIKIDNAIATYSLISGSTGYSCYGQFAAPGYANGEYSFEGGLQLSDNANLNQTLGLLVLNQDSIMSQKGSFSFQFVTQKREQVGFVAVIMVPAEPDKTLSEQPDLASTGWGGWPGP